MQVSVCNIFVLVFYIVIHPDIHLYSIQNMSCIDFHYQIIGSHLTEVEKNLLPSARSSLVVALYGKNLSSVCFQISSQVACMRRRMVALL